MRARSYTLILLAVFVVAACAPRLQDPGPDATRSMAPQLTADMFSTSDGVALPLRRWLPEGDPKAVVVALHGFNDYSNAFADIGRGPKR
jgi:hypothetical protein